MNLAEEFSAVLISDWQLWLALQDEEPDLVSSNMTVCTPNPGVYEALAKEGYRVFDTSSLITNVQTDNLGLDVFEVSKKFAAILDDGASYGLKEYSWGKIFSGTIHQSLICLCYHYMEMEKISEHFERILVPVFRDGDPLNKGLAPLQMNYYSLLNYAAIDLPGIAFFELGRPDRQDSIFLPGKKMAIANTELGWFGKWLLRISSRNNNYIGRLIVKIIRTRSLQLNAHRNRRNLILYKPNELLTQRLLGLVLSGYRLSQFKQSSSLQRLVERNGNGADEGVLIALKESMVNSVSKLPLYSRYSQLIELTISRICRYLNWYLIPAIPEITNSIRKQGIQDNAVNGQKTLLLSNGISAPFENLTAEILSKDFSVPVICCEHGGIGLLKHYRTLQNFSDMTRSDAYLCFNEYEKDYFFKHVSSKSHPEFFVNGAWAEVSSPFPSIAKKMVRYQWGIKSSEMLVLYVPTRFKDGHLWFPYGLRDMPYWGYIKSLVYKAIANTKVQAVIKVHQKGISSAGMKKIYHFRKSPFETLELPKNVQIKGYPDLTYSRHAADIIIVDRATSTIGWALSSQAIIIYLNSSVIPLEPEIASLMEKAIFVIDLDVQGWEDELVELLNNKKHRENLWNEKKNKRDVFIRDYVLGPRTDGKSFRKFLTEFLNDR